MASLISRSTFVGRCALSIAARPVCRPPSARLASTVTKPAKRATKTATDSVPKKKISTKSAAPAAPAKSPRKKAEPAVAAPGATETPGPAAKKTTRAASTKAPATKKADSGTKSSTPKTTTTRTRKTAAAASQSESTLPPAEPASAPSTTSTMLASSAPLPDIEQSLEQEVKKRVAPQMLGQHVDTESPEYKKASKRYVSVMVALPILFVTSYFLFDRLALGHEAKKLSDFVAPITPPAAASATNESHQDTSP